MKVGVYPGSFDPFTNGHLDILTRSCKIFDHVIVGVLENSAKSPVFTSDEKIDFIQRCISSEKIDCEIVTFSGLLVNFARKYHANAIIRGLRAVTDFEYELQIASLNKQLAPDIETMFLMTSTKYSYLSASIVREIASWDGPIDEFVHPSIIKDIQEKLRSHAKI